MMTYAMSLFFGGCSMLGTIILFSNEEYVQGRFIAFLALLVVAAVVFRVMALLERGLDDVRAESK